MTAVETTCPSCGSRQSVETPDGDSGAARWLRAMAKRVLCNECAALRETEAAAREAREARDHRRRTCQLPEQLRGHLLGGLEARDGQGVALAAVSEWAGTRRPGTLVLTGKVGTGKTLLAAAACWTRLERWPCRFASVARSMASLNARFTDEGREAAVKVFAGTGAIVLDDLDKCRPTDYGIEQLFSAIDGRQQAGAPLLVTTNLKPGEIGETFGTPLMSRLAHPHARVVEVGGEDWRVKGRAA